MTTMTIVAPPLADLGRRRLLASLILAPLLLAALPVAAEAQYFGRNKIQYESFDWYVLETERFDIHAYESQNDTLITGAGRMLERWYARLSGVFGHEFEEKKPIILYADQPDFQQTNTTPSTLSQATGGFTESLKDRIVLPFTETLSDTDHVLGHELVHAFQYDIAKQAALAGGQQGLQRLPLWVVEGLAEYLSTGRDDPHTAMWLRDALLNDRLPDLDDLSRDPRYFPYRWGHAFWAFVGGRWGDRQVPLLYQAMARSGVDQGAREILATDKDTLGTVWMETTREYFTPYIQNRETPAQAGQRVLAPEIDAGEMNLGPVLSPDGSRVAFLSERDLFSIDLFLADARTGQVLGKLAESDRDPHFDALSFLTSAGTWSPDGRRFAFAAFDEGDGAIAIADAEARRVDRRYTLGGEVGEVHSLTWSPDGRTIVFGGAAGGVTDLWELDVDTGAVERLTADVWSELQPDFSPDGRTIAFATDRGGDLPLDELSPPSMGIGFLDRASGEIRVDRPFGERTKHINPRYGPDGSLWFLSDREGYSDVYRMDLASGDVFQVTRIATGVSGITALGPALTVARTTGDLLYTVFDDGNYIGLRRPASESRGSAVARGEVPAPAGTLPPVPPSSPVLVARYLEQPARDLPAGGTFDRAGYDSELALDYVSPPTAGVGVDRYGVGVGGSIGLWFSDMLGNRQVLTAFYGTGGIKDIGGEALYVNQGGRFNWGVVGGRIPYRSGFSTIEEGTTPGAVVVNLFLERTYFNRAGVVADYPFSPTRRIEGDLGFLNIGFDREVIRGFFLNGQQIGEDREDLDSPDALNFVQGSVALVNDFSYFGYTSPVRGGRSRFEVGGNAGTLDFATLLADWRRYFYLRPLTLAVRGLHFGRYGGDADTDRLTPLYVGTPTLVRGYSSGSFEVSECTPIEGSSCPEFDRLNGSRVAVANVELRVPFIGTERFGLVDGGGFLPLDLALFGDVGAAWFAGDEIEWSFDRDTLERVPVFSTGATARINLLGSAVIEMYYAYPFQRDTGWELGFQLAPGW